MATDGTTIFANIRGVHSQCEDDDDEEHSKKDDVEVQQTAFVLGLGDFKPQNPRLVWNNFPRPNNRALSR